MTNPRDHSRLSTLVAVVFPILSLLASAQDKEEFSYKVGHRAVISITNNYGPIKIKPSRNRQVVVTTVVRRSPEGSQEKWWPGTNLRR